MEGARCQVYWGIGSTRNGRCLALFTEFRSLSAGRFADPPFLDANPLENISTLRNMFAVIEEGAIIDRQGFPNRKALTKLGSRHQHNREKGFSVRIRGSSDSKGPR